MASFNLTVEDSSPLISYSPAGAWVDTPFPNGITSNYSGRSYHMTTTQGSSVTFTFNGTGLTVYGGRRSNYGTYTFSIDGGVVSTGTSESSQELSQQVLAAVAGLSNGQHTAVLTNTGPAMDIDFIQLVTQPNSQGSQVVTNVIDDSDSQIVYSPASSWQVNTNQQFLGGSLHFSQDPSASATVSFSGEAVAIYGTVAPDHANLAVTIDGQTAVMAGGSNGKATSLHAPVLVYYLNNLDPGSHTLQLGKASQNADAAAPWFDLDSISVFSSSSVSSPAGPSGVIVPPPTDSPLSSPTPSDPSLPPPTKSVAPVRLVTRLSTGAMVASIIGGVIGVLALLAIAYLLLLRRKRRRPEASPMPPMPPMSPGGLPIQDPKTMEAGFGTPSAKQSLDIVIRPPILPSRPVSIASYYSNPSPVAPLPIHSRSASDSSARSDLPLLLPQPISGRVVAPYRTGRNNAGPALNKVQGSGGAARPVRPKMRPPTMDLSMLPET